MKIGFYWLIIPVLLCVYSFRTAKQPSVLNKEIPAFSLKNAKGGFTGLADYPAAKGAIIIFTCNHCPFAKLYTERLNKLSAQYAPLGIPLIAINSMDSLLYEDETLTKMKARAKSAGFHFPYLQDCSQEVARCFAVTHTPSAFVLWKEGGHWLVKYSGAIDNNGQHPESATSYIKQAVDNLLLGKEVSIPETTSFGCSISYRKR